MLRDVGGAARAAPLPQDKRFIDPQWRAPRFGCIYQAFLLIQQWWHNAVTDVRGVTRQHEHTVAFATARCSTVFSSSNSPPANPEVLRRTREEWGG
jgi:polyhydroxyalkanoate synthase